MPDESRLCFVMFCMSCVGRCQGFGLSCVGVPDASWFTNLIVFHCLCFVSDKKVLDDRVKILFQSWFRSCSKISCSKLGLLMEQSIS